MGRFLAPKSDFPRPELLGFSIPDLILNAGIAGYGPYTPICCPREPGSDSQTERTSQWKRLMQRTNGNFRPFSGIFRRIFLDLQGAGVWPGAGVASGGRRAFRRAGVCPGRRVGARRPPENSPAPRGPACASGPTWHRLRVAPGGRRVPQARPGIASGSGPRKSLGKAEGAASGGRREIRARENPSGTWPRSGPLHLHRGRGAARTTPPSGPFHLKAVSATGFWSSGTGFGL